MGFERIRGIEAGGTVLRGRLGIGVLGWSGQTSLSSLAAMR